MCATFSEDDVGKRVESVDGQAIGLVAAVEGDRARVETEPSATDSIKAALGWESGDETVPIAADDVGEITDDAVRLASDRRGSSGDSGGHDSVIEREEGGGQRNVGPASGNLEAGGEGDEALEGEGGADRHADNENAPPEGDRTVTRERGEEDDR